VINADGTALTRLIDTGDHIASPWWMPDIREAADATESAATDATAVALTRPRRSRSTSALSAESN
jgi:hypothetical protein